MWLFQAFPLLLLFLSALQAQSALEGRVADPQGAPIPGVTLLLMSRDGRALYSVRTAEDGCFRFPAAAPGDYVLEAAAPEFAASVRSLRLPADASQPIDIPLALAAVNEQVLITATGGPLLPQETAHAASSLEAADLQIAQKDSLSDALAALPGLRIERTGGPGSFTNLIFRGLRTTDTSILLDGLPVRDTAGFRGDLAAFFSDLSPSGVSSVEVVRGPGSVLYGSAAAGGVINFVPRESTEGPRLSFGYEGGSLAQAIGRLSLAGTAGERLGYSASVVRTDVNAGEDGDDVWRNTNVAAHARYRPRPGMSVSGNLYLSDTPRLNLNANPFPIGPAGNELGYEAGRGPILGFVSNLDDPDNYRTSRILPVSVRFDHTVSAAYGYSVAWQSVFARRNFPSGPLQAPLLTQLGAFPLMDDVSRFDGDDHLIDTRHTLALGRLSLLSFGYQYERQSATQEFVSGSFRDGPTTDRQSSHAAFFHEQLALLSRRLQISFGGRFETFRLENPESVPELRGLRTPSAKTGDVSLAYFLARSGTKLRAHGGNAFREPSLSERFQIATLSGRRVRIGNPLIEPERSVSFDAGFDQFLLHDRVQLAATYFYHRLQSLIQSGTLFQQANVRGGLSRGVELELRARPARFLALRWAYTYVNSEFLPAFALLRADGTTAQAGLARPQENIPAHTWGFSATLQRGRWDGFLDLAAISGYDSPLYSPVAFIPVLFRFDGYARVGIGFGYTRPLSERWRMRWFARVENALNKLYYEEGFRSPRAVGMAGVRFLF